MNSNHDLVKDSILQFEGNIPDVIKGVCLKYISEFHVRYLIYSLSSNDEISSEIEEVLHDILSNGGVKFDTDGKIKGYKYVIEYEFLPSVESIIESVKGVKFVWIYPQPHTGASVPLVP